MRNLLPACLAACLALTSVAGDDGWERAVEGYDWAFPRDHYSHDGYRTEWWYLTGQLESVADPSRRFGYQFTLFRIGLAPERPAGDSVWSTANVAMGHAALGDIARGEHRFAEVLYREVPFLAGFLPHASDDAGPVAWTRGPVGTDDTWTIDWNGAGFDVRAVDRTAGFEYELSTRAARPLVFQGPGGLSRKARDRTRASLYYSFTRLDTEGSITVDGERIAVRGTSWMDKEFGSGQLARHQQGWDWFSLQLDDGRDLMLYVLRAADGTVDFARGTLVGPDGTVRYLRPEAWTLTAQASWKSPETGIVYPAGWTLELPNAGLRLDVQPAFAAQENKSRLGNIAYWEGAVTVAGPDGRSLGRGYVELTGYGEGNRPGL